MWIERWNHLVERLKQQEACVHPIEIQPVATEQELLQVEARLGVQIPSGFRQLLQNCSKQVSIYWSLPEEAILPIELLDTPSGEFGWSLNDLDFPYFGENDESDEQQYLQFLRQVMEMLFSLSSRMKRFGIGVMKKMSLICLLPAFIRTLII